MKSPINFVAMDEEEERERIGERRKKRRKKRGGEERGPHSPKFLNPLLTGIVPKHSYENIVRACLERRNFTRIT